MGAAAYVPLCAPDALTQEEFKEVAGAIHTESLWKQLHSRGTGNIDSKAVLNFAKLSTDVFLTHDWGTDELERQNHARVSCLNTALQAKGLTTWFDEDKMEGFIFDGPVRTRVHTKCFLW